MLPWFFAARRGLCGSEARASLWAEAMAPAPRGRRMRIFWRLAAMAAAVVLVVVAYRGVVEASWFGGGEDSASQLRGHAIGEESRLIPGRRNGTNGVVLGVGVLSGGGEETGLRTAIARFDRGARPTGDDAVATWRARRPGCPGSLSCPARVLCLFGSPRAWRGAMRRRRRWQGAWHRRTDKKEGCVAGRREKRTLASAAGYRRPREGGAIRVFRPSCCPYRL